MQRNLDEGTNPAVTTATPVSGQTTQQSKDFPRHACHFRPIHRSTDRDITTGGNRRGESRRRWCQKRVSARCAELLSRMMHCLSPDCRAWHGTTQVLAARSQHRGRHPSHAHKVHSKTRLPSCSKLLEICCLHRICLSLQHDLDDISFVTLSQQHAFHNTPSIKGPRWLPLSRRHLRQRQPSHPSDPALHRRRCCGSSRHLREPPRLPSPGNYAPKRGLSACPASLSSPTCDP